jgi:hypothetical protein
MVPDALLSSPTERQNTYLSQPSSYTIFSVDIQCKEERTDIKGASRFLASTVKKP